MKIDYRNAPVTAPYARDMVLEAQRLLLPAHPYAESVIFVEFFEMPGFALHKDDGVVFYNPDTIMQVPLDNLCRIVSEIFHAYAMNLMEEHAPPEGTVLH